MFKKYYVSTVRARVCCSTSGASLVSCCSVASQDGEMHPVRVRQCIQCMLPPPHERFLLAYLKTINFRTIYSTLPHVDVEVVCVLVQLRSQWVPT
eukprot:1754289-Amphidinium_carterae.1